MASHGISRSSQGPAPSAEEREKELARIDSYQVLVEEVNGRISRGEFCQETLNATSKLLARNPEYYTVWNHRRRTLRHLINRALESVNDSTEANESSNPDDTISALIDHDLAFLLPLLRKFPKCYWIWNYRLWLLEESTKTLRRPFARNLWEQELTLVGKMLTLDSRNFHGWGYRRTVIAALESPALQDDEKPPRLTQQEFDYTTKMINVNLSNFSAWHNRSKLIPRLLRESNASGDDRRKLLDEELDLIQRALWAGDNDSSLWFYHQYLLSAFDPDAAPQSVAPDLTNTQREEYLSIEIDKVLDMLDGAEDCKWIYQALLHMSDLYLKTTGELPSQAASRAKWLDQLERVDQLRVGRWRDVRARTTA